MPPATQRIRAGATRYAYLRMGGEAGVPLILLQNFRQGMDGTDDCLSRCRTGCALPVPGVVPETQQAFPGFATDLWRGPEVRNRTCLGEPQCASLAWSW